MREQLPKVMIVDDEPLNHTMMEAVLKKDYELVSVESGEACLQMLANDIPDVILLDIMMPGMNGYDVCQTIKTHEDWKNIPVIFVSAEDSLESRLKGYEYGAEDYFIKPFNKQKLLNKVEQILSYQSEKKQKDSHVAQANQVAMQAMTTSSDLGVVLRFIQSSFTAQSYDEILSLVFDAMGQFGLQCCIQLRVNDEVINKSEAGISSPLEDSILTYAQNKGRILDSDNKSIFNHQHISILIKNMPIEDEIRYGNVKDNVCFLLDGAEARILSLRSELELRQNKDQLIQIIQYANQTMEKINEDMHKLRMDGANIVEDMLEKMNELIPDLQLEEYQEESILAVTEEGLEKTTALFNKGIKIDECFMEILQKLYEVSQMQDNSNDDIEQFKSA